MLQSKYSQAKYVALPVVKVDRATARPPTRNGRMNGPFYISDRSYEPFSSPCGLFRSSRYACTKSLHKLLLDLDTGPRIEVGGMVAKLATQQVRESASGIIICPLPVKTRISDNGPLFSSRTISVRRLLVATNQPSPRRLRETSSCRLTHKNAKKKKIEPGLVK